MLRITRTTTTDSTLIRLEGKLLAPWTDEVRKQINCGAGVSCAVPEGAGQAPASGHSLRLDLRDLSYIDSAGATLLCGLIRRGATIENCSQFIAELLHLEKP